MSKRQDNKENEYVQESNQCTKHKGKKAKYRVVNVPQCGKGKYQLCEQVCSKCAVTLVTQGYKVEETDIDILQQRQEDIQQFLFQINSCFTILDQTEQSMLDKKLDLQKFCDKQRKKVREYYQKIVMALENRMNEQLVALNDAQQLMEESYDNRQAELRDCHNDLIQMYSDIEVNLESILTQIDQVPYKQVMSQYQRRIQTSTNQLNQLSSENIPLIKVQLKKSEQLVLGGLFEDSELEMRPVQTALLKLKENQEATILQEQSVSRMLMSPPGTGLTSCMTTATPKQELVKQRSLSQPTYGPQKYLDILQKVNENQLKKNDFYSTLLRKDLNPTNAQNAKMAVSLSSSDRQYCLPKFK